MGSTKAKKIRGRKSRNTAPLKLQCNKMFKPQFVLLKTPFGPMLDILKHFRIWIRFCEVQLFLTPQGEGEALTPGELTPLDSTCLLHNTYVRGEIFEF